MIYNLAIILFINGESQYSFVKESYISEPNFVHVSILRIASKGRGDLNL
jgi:hypothetical protein